MCMCRRLPSWAEAWHQSCKGNTTYPPSIFCQKNILPISPANKKTLSLLSVRHAQFYAKRPPQTTFYSYS